ncbi:MAG: hypothetical protein ABSE53_07530 [Terracidiphilus sp.]|jgi:hypothetical protein
MSGILESVFGGDPKQYVQSGFELTQLLVKQFSLPGWVNGHPSMSVTEEQYLDEILKSFQEGSLADARRQGGESLSYHPDYWAIIERSMTDCALRLEAIENPEGEPWRVLASTNLKAWASGLNPWAMLSVAEILIEQGETRYARRVIDTSAMFPRYWNSRPTNETNFILLSYVTLRSYAHHYDSSGLKDVGEPHFMRNLSADLSALRAKT